MNFLSILLIAFAMSTDAFAVAIGKGAALERPSLLQALRIGLVFGLIEALTPVIGWALGSVASRAISDWDHWVAFILLTGLGIRMIHAGYRNAENNTPPVRRAPLSTLLLTAFATSIDAMAIGLSFAFIEVNILTASLTIGCITLVMVTTGVMLGRVLGQLVGRRAEMLGGLILILVGSLLLAQHI